MKKNTNRKQTTGGHSDDLPFEISFRLQYSRGRGTRISGVKLAQPNSKGRAPRAKA